MSKLGVRMSHRSLGAVVLVLVGLASIVIGVTRSQAGKSESATMTIRIVGDRNHIGGIYGPELTILLCNHSDDLVWVRNDIWRAEPWSWNPLQASIVDVETGKAVPTRVEIKRDKKILRESDFVELQLRSCYGPIMDLRKNFILKAGKKYKVKFTYSSLAPAKVGKIIPWKGKITSETVVIGVPKR